ncbi:pyridoxal phosphate-dependent transferase [Polychytrium aggregatum]|uniref:pyridoxal phosphate-dependent transferase n=1 Tax=Polychytrium aggregatum TaxID=110093 RepID=UPI0022FE692A|nr:pyridoxal phosphate-dependent transferase [Polychytrium aggregatum]KAI9204690.1 pyridoxal phosphate-dependent transferase [Polychytrium aggregatum]
MAPGRYPAAAARLLLLSSCLPLASLLDSPRSALRTAVAPTSAFENVPLAPPDAIFHVAASHRADPDPSKINLGIGAYRDDNGSPWVLPVVRRAEKLILEDSSLDHEYLPIAGLKSFTDASVKLILGDSSPAILEKRFAANQTISGTGAVRLGAEFLARFHKSVVYISNPTWAVHRNIFSDSGFEVREYKYWNESTRGLDLESVLSTFQSAPEGSILVLHACAHNPTGVDPTLDQWKQISDVVKAKNHFVFFDCAYQGFASGDLDRDAQAVRYFVEEGHELFVAQSYAKNFGLYGERIGCLTVVAQSTEQAKNISSQLERITRSLISNPPTFGARIVSLVLNNPELYEQWKTELKSMADRIILMREQLYDALVKHETPGTWNHIVDQIGMFSFTGLNPTQCKLLTDKFHVYLASSGRISMAGLNSKNVQRFADAVDYVVRNA